jgi:hypothetical protein
MKPNNCTLLFALLLITVASEALGDIAFPTNTKIFFFDAKNNPVRTPLKFTISCYGYSAYPNTPEFHKPYPKPGSFTPSLVKRISAECPNFGCEISDSYYKNYIRIDFCDMDGTVGGKPFSLKKYGSSPIDMSKCAWSTDQKRECTATFKLPR